jgi:hypothetical protein
LVGLFDLKNVMTFWFENGVRVESHFEKHPTKQNWLRQWTIKDGVKSGYCYYHRIHGGTFLYTPKISKTCELYPTEKATIKLTYGLYESGVHAHNLSQKACNELWEKCKPLVNLGLMHWSMKPILT